MNKPTKKILYFITKSNWGGTQKYVYDLATNLVINSDEIISNHTTLTTGDDGLALDSASKSKLFYNFEVVVYAGLSGNSNILFEKIDEFNSKVATVGRHLGMVKKGSLNKIRTARLNLHNDFNIWKSFFNLFEFYKILKNEKPEVIHVNSSKISVMMALVARVYNMVAAVGGHHEKERKHFIKIIFTGHGWPHSEIHRNKLWRAFTQLCMIFTVILSHKTICVSQATRDALLENNFLNKLFKKYLDKKTVIIHNGVNQNNKIQLPKLRETIDSPHYGKINLVSIGDYHPNKGHDTVIRYLNKLDNTHYHIIGNGEWRAHLENLIDENKLHSKVHLLHIPENAAHVLNRYDIYLQPSRKEGFSIAIPEALQAGLPVIARDVGGARELLHTPSNSTQDLTPNPSPIERGTTQQAALTLYKEDHELTDILKNWKVESLQTYHEWIDDRFSIEHMIDETVKLYKD